jgi:hypothetical protein
LGCISTNPLFPRLRSGHPLFQRPSQKQIPSIPIEPIEPPWLAIKEWIPDDEPDLNWFNRPRNPSNPDPDGIDQSPAWKAPEIHLDDGRILVLEYT